MGDRTYHQAYIYDCPPEKVGVVLDVLENHGFGLEYDNGVGEDQLCLVEKYHRPEAYLGTSLEFASELTEKAPEVTFNVWEDPKYEYLGQGLSYAPALGTFTYDCGSEGEPLFNVEEVRRIVDTTGDARERLLGTPWDTAMVALAEQHKDVVLDRLSS